MAVRIEKIRTKRPQAAGRGGEGEPRRGIGVLRRRPSRSGTRRIYPRCPR